MLKEQSLLTDERPAGKEPTEAVAGSESKNAKGAWVVRFACRCRSLRPLRDQLFGLVTAFAGVGGRCGSSSGMKAVWEPEFLHAMIGSTDQQAPWSRIQILSEHTTV